ncbi:MAG: YhgE/Pip domain-containing protein [Lachnospiraceae bacterium]|nr:YhgE/Pip domain-containing protein [Lachnospiraceae bacterium]
MKTIRKIFLDDMKQLVSSFFIIVIILGITVIPALYAWLNIYSNWDPYGNTAGLKIAFYSSDEGITEDGVTENVGDELKKEMEGNDAIHWVFTDSEEQALSGVRSGEYYAAIVIESDFTYRIMNFFKAGVDKPAILFYQNQKKNPVATKISDAVVEKIHKSLNKKLTGVIVGQVFDTANSVEVEIESAGGIKGIVTDMDDLNDEIKSYQKTINSVVAGNEVLLDAIGEGKADAAQAGQRIDSTRASLDETGDQITMTELTLDYYMDNVKITLDTAENHLSAIQAKLRQGEMSGDVGQMGAAVSSAALDLNALMDDIDALNQSVGRTYLPSGDEITPFLPKQEEIEKAASACHKVSATLTSSSAILADISGKLKDVNKQENLDKAYQVLLDAGKSAARITSASAIAMQSAADTAQSAAENIGNLSNPDRTPEKKYVSDDDWKKLQENARDTAAAVQDSADAMKALAASAEAEYKKIQDSKPQTEKEMSDALEQMASLADTASSTLSQYADRSENAGDTLDHIAQNYYFYIQAARQAIRQTADQIDSTLTAYYNSLAALRTQFNNAIATTAGDTAVTNTVLAEKQASDKIEAILKELMGTEYTFENEIRPNVDACLESLTDVVGNISNLLNSLSTTVSGMGNVFDALQISLTSAQDSLTKTSDLLGLISDRLTEMTGKVEDVEHSQELTIIMNTLSGDPEKYSEFFSEPVQIEDNVIYPVENYGSAVTPFYTTLSIWVGALVLAAILKTKAKSSKYPGATQAQLYFGRYITYFILSQAQTLVTVLGDLYYFKVQCLDTFLFWFACAFTSMVFSLLIYSLVLAFGDVGKAIAVVMVVIQIAGSSGTYPIELLPDFFQKVYLFFPFPYAINAMRETIGGLYDGAFALYLLELSVFIVVALVIGLLIQRPFRKLNKFMMHRMEDSRLF